MLADNGGNVELSTVGGNFQVQPAGGVSKLTVHPGGQINGSVSGRGFGLNDNNWKTFGKLYQAQGGPLVIRVSGGHNSTGTFSQFVDGTYAYGIAAGSVVTIGNTATGSNYTVQVRKVKRIGGADFASGDGGWEYQVARNQSYGFAVHINVEGGGTAFKWEV